MTKLLISWIGATDLRAANGDTNAGIGPIGQAAMSQQYDKIALLSNFAKAENDDYVQWLCGKEGAGAITLHPITLSSPTNYGEIYSAAVEIISLLTQEHNTDTELTFHLSPGTPAMAAAMFLKSRPCWSAVINLNNNPGCV